MRTLALCSLATRLYPRSATRTVAGGSLTDAFADTNAVHIYRLAVAAR